MTDRGAAVDLHRLPLGAGGRSILYSDLDVDEMPLPPGGRAPGWVAGIAVARRHPSASSEAQLLERNVR